MTTQTIFLKEKSLENFSDAAVLELLLTTAGVRGDVPAMISRLFETFYSFKGILEARPEQLQNVPGITQKTATLISMVVPLARVWERACMDTPASVRNCREAEAYCRSLLMGERMENFYVICLNAQCNVLGHQLISQGSLSEVSAYPRKVVEAALNLNAHSVIFSHNHPGGTCSPSAEDIMSTIQLQKLLQAMGITVLDHIIVAGNACYSLAQHGDFSIR